MPNRHLVLNREALTTLDPDDLASVAAGAISQPNPLCVLSNPRYSCPTCGIACTFDCPTPQCGTDKC